MIFRTDRGERRRALRTRCTMNRYASYLITALFALLSCTTAVGQVDTLTVIHVNDTHSNPVPFDAGQHGGLSRAASVIGQWKQEGPNPLLVHTGDLMVGTLMFNAHFGVPELQLLDAMGFDAFLLGNHEFDVGAEQLGGILETAALSSNFSVLGTNLENVDAVPVLSTFVKPHVVKVRGNLTVGILGLTTPAANVESSPAPIVISADLVEVAMVEVAELKATGCDVIILLSHLGMTLDSQIAAAISGVDAIIGGHSHTALQEVRYVSSIPIVQAGSFYRHVGKLRLVVDGSGVSVLDYEQKEITDQIAEEPVVAATVEYLKQGIRRQYESVLWDPYAVIGQSRIFFNAMPTTVDTLDTPLGNLITWALLASGLAEDIDMAIEPTGHLAADIPPGDVTAAELFRAYPYGYDESDGLGFRAATYSLLGGELLAVLGALMGNVEPDTGYYDYLIQSAGLKYSVSAGAQGLAVEEITVSNTPIDPDRRYTIISSDRVVGYLQTLFGIAPGDLVIHPISVFDVARTYVETAGEIDISGDGHIGAVGTAMEAVPELARGFQLRQNYPDPFNPTTTIPFRLERPGSARLEIFDVLGRLIQRKVFRFLSSGEHRIAWDARDTVGNPGPSGLYLYRLVVDGNSSVRAMQLVR